MIILIATLFCTKTSRRSHPIPRKFERLIAANSVATRIIISFETFWQIPCTRSAMRSQTFLFTFVFDLASDFQWQIGRMVFEDFPHQTSRQNEQYLSRLFVRVWISKFCEISEKTLYVRAGDCRLSSMTREFKFQILVTKDASTLPSQTTKTRTARTIHSTLSGFPTPIARP